MGKFGQDAGAGARQVLIESQDIAQGANSERNQGAQARPHGQHYQGRVDGTEEAETCCWLALLGSLCCCFMTSD